MDLDSVAQELYGLPLNEFVPTRNARAKEARAGGDRELAAEIQSLAKPTIAAWLVNQLTRHGSDLDPLIDLGRQLRAASAKLDGETMRSLGRARSQLISDLLTEVRHVGAAHGHRVSDDVTDEVRQTLEASLSDSEIADAVAAGRLTRSVEYAGFGELVGLGGPTGVVGKPAPRRTPERPARSERPVESERQVESERPAKQAAKDAAPPSRPTDLADRRRKRAEREAAEAAQRLETAQQARDEAAQESERAAADVERAEAEVARLRTDLATAERAAKAARQADRAAGQSLARAERELSGAERVHDRAAAKLGDLAD